MCFVKKSSFIIFRSFGLTKQFYFIATDKCYFDLIFKKRNEKIVVLRV